LKTTTPHTPRCSQPPLTSQPEVVMPKKETPKEEGEEGEAGTGIELAEEAIEDAIECPICLAPGFERKCCGAFYCKCAPSLSPSRNLLCIQNKSICDRIYFVLILTQIMHVCLFPQAMMIISERADVRTVIRLVLKEDSISRLASILPTCVAM